MTKYVEPEFKAIHSTTEDVLTTSPVQIEIGDFSTDQFEDGIMPISISG